MSARSDSPKSVVFEGDDDKDMLESLRGLSIKGFHDCTEPNANTPSSTNASLPTPPALKSSHIYLASPERPYVGHSTWYPEERTIPPNAPLMKDLDSFTEGTGQGSFDFPLASGPDEPPRLPLIFHPTENFVAAGDISPTIPSPLALDLLPSPSDPTDAVLAWRESVSATSEEFPPTSSDSPSPPKKRRRSFTQDSDNQERRTRAWSPTIDSSFIPYSENHEDTPEVLEYRSEPDAPG
ncbi:hypothetical protein JR316_0008951 [Psilocybe cubensis]|uniref:Uncharacterized protein n=2 Tax=Psilocybe cubensis TaxID=181762 RepID=A0A8H7XYV0_PSICU|nr:hypothetical protein JR316_0008951 [Psilocybe cubensis]KAH9478496.1 hypothetical protein JR316_0008951 [Psilocybe cubensis]